MISPTTGTGGDVVLQLPSQGEPTWFPVSESPETVLVQFDPVAGDEQLAASNGLASVARQTWLLRCAADDGTCEVALAPG